MSQHSNEVEYSVVDDGDDDEDGGSDIDVMDIDVKSHKLQNLQQLLTSVVQRFGFEFAYSSAEIIIDGRTQILSPGVQFISKAFGKSVTTSEIEYIFLAVLIRFKADPLTERNITDNSGGRLPYSFLLILKKNVIEIALDDGKTYYNILVLIKTKKCFYFRFSFP